MVHTSSPDIICNFRTLFSLTPLIGSTNNDTGLLYALLTSQNGFDPQLFTPDLAVICDFKKGFETPLSVLLHLGLCI